MQSNDVTTFSYNLYTIIKTLKYLLVIMKETLLIQLTHINNCVTRFVLIASLKVLVFSYHALLNLFSFY